MSGDLTRALARGAYVVLGSLLVWSRLYGLDNTGFCCDEIATVTNYVRPGPSTILTGAYAPNNHELYSLLAWATSTLFGESEVALRLGAAIPFVAGVAVVTVWLHRRVGVLSAVLFLLFATASPLLLDLSRQARGYGLAFLAMSVLTVVALEADRMRPTVSAPIFFGAGLVGTFTLPHFAVAFAAIAAVLASRPRLRRWYVVGSALSAVAIAAWYAPHVDDIASSSSQDYGAPIPTAWLLTAPFDQILRPAFTSLDETLVRPSIATLVGAVVLALAAGSSPLLRDRRRSLVLVPGTVVTVLVFWATGTHVVPRFWSYLLVPLLLVLATGCAEILGRLTSEPARWRTIVVVGLLTFVGVWSLPELASVPFSRRDSLREVAASIRQNAVPGTPVYAYMPYSDDLEFHLGRHVVRVDEPDGTAIACRAGRAAVLVSQPWFRPAVVVPSCAAGRGARHYRFDQYARGDATDVWFIDASDE